MRDLRLVEFAMHLAVSILSPVSIHILIPARLNESMQSAMLFCNLSSTPVTHERVEFFSSSFMRDSF